MTPADMSGRLAESEHRGRYWWSASLAANREVLDAGCGTGYGSDILAAAGARRVVGIDVSEEAIAEARLRSEEDPVELMVASLHELPFAEDSFDLAVCFEVIEHIDRRDQALLELRRVLRPGGVLAISSPNRGVYPPGNPHHVHEYRATEFREALAAVFPFVRVYRQSPWLAAAVLDDDESQATGAEDELTTRVIKIAAVEPGEEMFTLALASAAPITAGPQSLVALGHPFELGWWHEQVHQARVLAEDRAQAAELADQGRLDVEAKLRVSQRVVRELTRSAALAERRRVETETALGESGRALLAVESELAVAHDRLAALESAQANHREVEVRRAGKEVETMRRLIADLEPRVRRAERTVSDMDRSLSWRLTQPLRTAKRMLRGR
jgi:SAM-dependent methyltransferase